MFVEYDVLTSNWRMSQVRIINNSDYPCVARIYELGVLRFTAVGVANDTTSWNTVGIQLGLDPEDGNLNLGPYTVTAQWPGEAL